MTEQKAGRMNTGSQAAAMEGLSGPEADRITALAEEVLDISRNRLLVNLCYLDTALTFHSRKIYDGTVSTDGKVLYFCPVHILRTYHRSKEEMTRIYLHLVLHCIFHHPFNTKAADNGLWDLACDIAVESTVNELGLRSVKDERADRQQQIINRLRRENGFLTAEKICSGLKNGLATAEETEKWKELFVRDSHEMWCGREASSPETGTGSSQVMMPGPEAAASWKKMAEQIEMDVEMFAKVRGRYASSLMQNLRAVNRERYDYGEFLRKFASAKETLKVSDDQFDYIYYTYGLRNYGNMPLIEPLEYKEDKKIKDFVIAIDTSGSVAGEEVQEFLQKTYNILKSRESFGSRINVHIIQCDAKIQSDTVLTSQEDLERYTDHMEIRGLGGTDFRPVFTYVDELLKSGEFSDLRGLLYFTDGLGIFPREMPGYRTAFIFLEKGYNIPEVPPWAMKVILHPEEY